MKIVTNEKLVRRNKQIAQYISLFSFVVLIGSFFLTTQQALNVQNQPTSEIDTLFRLLPTIILPVVFATTLISVRMTNLWLRQPRPEMAIHEGLKGISNKSVLYNYFHFPARHVLICPKGVFAIVTRFQDGEHSVKGGEWSSKRGLAARLLGALRMESIGNPTFEARTAAAHIQTFFDKFAPDIKVQPLIVFVDPSVKLTIESPEVPVVHASDEQTPNLRELLREVTESQKSKQKDKSSSGHVIANTRIGQLIEQFEDIALPKA